MSKVVQTADIKALVKNNIRNYSMFIMLALIMIIFAPLTNGSNWNERNFYNIFYQNSHILILAIGMVMVIIVQGIDLSVGSVCAFIGAISVFLYNLCIRSPVVHSFAMPITLIGSIGLGALIGAYQGLWTAFGKIPAFIVTLSGMLLFRGLTYIVTNVNPINPVDNGYQIISSGTLDEILGMSKIGHYYPMSFVIALLVLAIFFYSEFAGRKKKINYGFEIVPTSMFITKLVLISLLALGLAERLARFRGLPIIVIVLGITIAAFHFILNNTVLGRYIYAVGGNPRSAKLSGINSEGVVFVVFCMMGGLAGLAAIVSTGYMNSALPQAGDLFELDTIAACYIGGVSAGGGIGSVVGVIVGGLVMAAINNGMILMNLGVHYQRVVKGLILVLAVFYDVYSRRKSGLG